MKGKDKFASLFYFSLYLSSSISKNMYIGLTKSVHRNVLRRWQELFEKTLFLYDLRMQKKYNKIDIEYKFINTKDYFKLYKSIVKRQECIGLKIPKIHNLLHIFRTFYAMVHL